MNCEAARDLLLEASPEELQSEDDSELARHLAECPGCRRLARAFLEGQAALDREIDSLSRMRSDEETLLAVRRRLAGGAVGDGDSRTSLRFRRGWSVAAPLAAAAALTALLFGVRHESGPAPARTVSAPVAPAAAPGPQVDVQADRRFAVMRTDDPKIHVVWFY